MTVCALHVCLRTICMHYMYVCAPYVCLEPEETREVLELELQPVMSYCGYWEWKELGSPGRAASAASHHQTR